MQWIGIALMAVLLFYGPVMAQAQTPAPRPTATTDSSMASAPVHFFQRFLSGADGDRCPMTPTCSAYALEAIDRHGSLMGWVMTCDRLMRCGRDELHISPSVPTPDGMRCFDPLNNNDFWWR